MTLKNPKSTDLEDASVPEDVGQILRNAAQRMRESESELQAAWQDRNAGRAWRKIAGRLEQAALVCDRLAKEL